MTDNLNNEAKLILDEWMRSYGAHSSFYEAKDSEKKVLLDLADRLKGNYPFHHPSYAGQMLKPPARIALEAYHLAQTINPNNHALDGGPPTSEMEKELILEYGRFFGFLEPFLGHLTSSGTLANLEALWVARQSNPSLKIAFSDQAHYTHERMCGVLGIDFIKIKTDAKGEWDYSILDKRKDEIGTIVVTLGTTGRGKVEALPKVLNWARSNGKRVHVDAAYGGYFHTLRNHKNLIESSPWDRISEVDSITIDPHKHGLQPYGCGMILFKDTSAGRFYKHDSPYTYFSSDDLHLGEISLECSRAGAAAAALWATQKVFPITGELFTKGMALCRTAAVNFAKRISQTKVFLLLEEPELDIVCYLPSVPSMKSSEISRVSSEIFHKSMENKNNSVYVSLFNIKSEFLADNVEGIEIDQPMTTILRSVFMKPEHAEFEQEIFERLSETLSRVK